KDWTTRLIENGKSPDTPVALVRRCSLPDQQMIRCRLDKVVESLTPYSKFPPPVICIVGKVTDEEVALNWFQHRRLFGQTVMVTRPAHQASGLGEQLADQGANVLYQPAIAIEPVEDWTAVDSAIERIGEFDWIVFSSANGVRAFLDRILQLGKDLRCLGRIRIAAVGTTTDSTLHGFHLRADLVPAEFRAESLAAEMQQASKPGKVLLVRASRGREVLGESLSTAGYDVEQIAAYQSKDVDTISPEIEKALEEGRIDWVTVTSSAIARSLSRLLGTRMGELRLVSISPVTSATLRELGHEPTVEAATYTMEGVVDAIAEAPTKT
ncbi:MAG: uroporphyrinogen-III synthase, partial [Planctomycetota bacterium]